MKPLILVDMDEVVFFTYQGFCDKLKQRHPDINPIPYEKVTEFYFYNLYPENQRERVDSVWREEGLFKNLPLMNGALEALTELERKNEVRICTSPITSPYCSKEKFESVRENLGEKWLKKIILTKDKTIIRGDILIDDKPAIKGIMEPTWEHILYSHPWNQHITDKRRLTWDNYKQVLKDFL